MKDFFNIFSPSVILAASNWDGLYTDEKGDQIATVKSFESIYSNILQIIISIAGIVFFIMLIIGGFKYLSSGGDSKKIESASSTLTTAVIGIIGVILAWLILIFIKEFTGIDVTKFTIKTF